MRDRIIESVDETRRINDFFKSSTAISRVLPVKLTNGATIDEVECYCSSCKKIIPPGNFRGDLNPSLRGYRMTAFGFCKSCNVLTPFIYELVPHGISYDLEPQEWRGWSNGSVVEFKK